jgi:hypothetical protein
MSPYLGTMPTAMLEDSKIRPTEFRKWKHAHRDFARRDKDRLKVEELKASIPVHGLLEPILLGVDDRYLDVYVGDGHHRAVALIDLGVKAFLFHWYWIRSFGVSVEQRPFPYATLGL